MEEKAPSTEALTRKLHEILTDTDNDDAGQYCFAEETIEKVMQELYKEINMASPPSPSNGSLLVQVDLQNESSTGFEVGLEKSTDEGEDFDDEWLARVLRSGQGQVVDTAHRF